jgi:CheY-like chemotaxis protein
LPSEPEAGGAAALPREAPARLDGAPRRVLLVEDNSVNQKVGAMMLAKLGCRVDLAANGLEALDLLDRFGYDIVFMDCQMPEMDGYSATRVLRATSNQNHRVPVIALTAAASHSDRDRCLASGMDDYLTKPVSLEALANALAGHARPEPAGAV